MAIKDLQARQGNVDIVVEVIDKGDVREFDKFGKKGRVCPAKAKDSSGEIVLSLWNEQIDEVNVGDTIHITNGYVSEFQGEPQLTTGKFGKIEMVSKAEKTGKEEPLFMNKEAKERMEKAKEEFSEEELSVDEEDIEF